MLNYIGKYLLIAAILIKIISSNHDFMWSTLLGGKGEDYANSITTDANGYIYITGTTASNPFDGKTKIGMSKAFIAKYNQSGELQWSSLLGGNGNYDETNAYSITANTNGNIYVAGSTSINPFDGKTNPSCLDIFIAIYNSSGALQWSTLLEGVGDSFNSASSISTDTNGNFYIAGKTNSKLFDGKINNGRYDAFIAKYNSSGVKEWSSLLGGTSNDSASSIATDSNGNIYITGTTDSKLFDGKTNNGRNDAFIAKYNSSGILQWSILLGGEADDEASSITIDADENIYITGTTSSVPFDGKKVYADYMAFIAKYNSSGVLQWSSLLGEKIGSKNLAYSIISSKDGSIYVAGKTSSNPFYGKANNGNYDAFIAKYNSSGVLQWSTLLGGVESEEANSITIDINGIIYIAGMTYSNPFDGNTNNGLSDAFIARVANIELNSNLNHYGKETISLNEVIKNPFIESSSLSSIESSFNFENPERIKNANTNYKLRNESFNEHLSSFFPSSSEIERKNISSRQDHLPLDNKISNLKKNIFFIPSQIKEEDN